MTPYEAAKRKGISDEQIIIYMKEKYGNNWVSVAKQKGIPEHLLSSYTAPMFDFNIDNKNIQTFNIPEYKQPVDTTTTMTSDEIQKQKELVESRQKAWNAFQVGDAKAFAGLARTILDGLNAIGVDTPDANKYIDTAISQFNKESQQLDKEGYGGYELTGRLLPDITATALARKPMGIFATSAVSGYSQARVDEDDKTTSAAIGGTSGLLGVGIYKLINKLTANKAEKLLNYLKEKYNISEEEVEKAYKDYLNFFEPSKNPETDKVKALIYSMGDHGKTLIDKAVTEQGIRPATGVIKETTDLVKSVENKLLPTKPSSETIKDIDTKAEAIKSNYRQFLESVGKYKTFPIEITLPEAADEVTMQTHKTLKELLSSEDLSVDKLIDAYQIASKLARNTRDKVKALKYNQLKNTIDKELKNILPDEKYLEWKKVNQDYYTMSRIYDTPFGKDIKEVVEGRQHPDVLINKILNSKQSQNKTLFESVEKLIGPEKAADFEKSIVAYAFGDSKNPALWNYLNKKLYTKGFVTKEGKELQQMMEKLSDSFNVMDKLRTTLKESKHETVGWSDDLISKAKYSIVTKIWNKLMQMLPTEEAKFQRKIDYLANILSKPNEVRNLISPEEYIRIVNITLNEVLKNPENLKEYFDNTIGSREKRMILYRNINEITKDNIANIKNKKLKTKLENAATEMKKAIKIGDFDNFDKSYNEYMKLLTKSTNRTSKSGYTGMRKGSVYIGGKNPLLPKNIIDFRYKLDDEIMKLNDKQKYNAEQLKKYLVNKGVSPKEIESSGIFRNDELLFDGEEFLSKFNKESYIYDLLNKLIKPYNTYSKNEILDILKGKAGAKALRKMPFLNPEGVFKKVNTVLNSLDNKITLTGKEWKDLINKEGKHRIQEIYTLNPKYADIRLKNTTNYQENLDLIPKTDYRNSSDYHFKDQYEKLTISMPAKKPDMDKIAIEKLGSVDGYNSYREAINNINNPKKLDDWLYDSEAARLLGDYYGYNEINRIMTTAMEDLDRAKQELLDLIYNPYIKPKVGKSVKYINTDMSALG
jgi:hypothetical protein